MDTLAKETMGLPIFICPTNNQVITSSGPQNSNSTVHSSSAIYNTSASSSAVTSPTTPTFFASATATRSPTSTTFLPSNSKPQQLSNRDSEARDARRNTYTPPTFSPRRESLLSTKRLSQAFDFASTVVEGAWKTATEQVFGEERQGEVWREDLESGDRETEKGRYRRFGDGDGFGEWLD